MKLRVLIAVAAITMFAACETTYRATDASVIVSDNTQTAFISQYPGATNIVWTNYDPQMETPIDWELAGWTALDAGDYLVRFDLDNENYYAWYNDEGEWIGTAYLVKDHASLPSAVSTTLTNQFPGYAITSVNREFQKDRMVYEIVLKTDDSKVRLLVDGEGTIVKQKTKTL